jgi:hypothetical protein
MTTTLTASTTAQLNQGIATANAAIAGGFIIALQGNITETTQLHAIDLQSGVPLTIDGSNGSGGIYTLNGAGSRGFVVDAGSVTIQNLGLSNAVLSGGSSAATVTLANDSFSRNVAITHGLTVDEIAPITFNSSTVTNQTGSTFDVGVIGSAFVAGLPNIAFAAQTTLAQSPNSADTGGTLTVTDGPQAAAIALLGNHMAGSFVAAAHGYGGTLVPETPQAHQPPPLSPPGA